MNPNSLIAPKRLYHLNEKRLIKVSEIMKSELSNIHHTEEYSKKGIKVISLSPEEILDYTEDWGFLIFLKNKFNMREEFN